MKKRILIPAAVIFLFTAAQNASAQSWLDNKLKSIKEQGVSKVANTSLSDSKIGEGLKEALKVGIKNAIAKTGQTDGFLKNETIKITIPEKLKILEKGLRTLGMSATVDEFVLSMNRAAEKAVPLATDTFMNALFDMTITDAQKLLNGGNTAATDYFKDKTYADLKELFRPTVVQTLKEFNVSKQYNDLVSRYKTLPFAKNMPVFDPEEYVLSQGLNGLFVVLGQEEAKIRTDPAARVTSLLKTVFK